MLKPGSLCVVVNRDRSTYGHLIQIKGLSDSKLFRQRGEYYYLANGLTGKYKNWITMSKVIFPERDLKVLFDYSIIEDFLS